MGQRGRFDDDDPDHLDRVTAEAADPKPEDGSSPSAQSAPDPLPYPDLPGSDGGGKVKPVGDVVVEPTTPTDPGYTNGPARTIDGKLDFVHYSFDVKVEGDGALVSGSLGMSSLEGPTSEDDTREEPGTDPEPEPEPEPDPDDGGGGGDPSTSSLVIHDVDLDTELGRDDGVPDDDPAPVADVGPLPEGDGSDPDV